jgi:hypothetical protein
MSATDKTPREMFDESIVRIHKSVEAAVTVSDANIGLHHTGRQNRALLLLAKIIVHTTSIISIIKSFQRSPEDSAILDHFSIAVLARCVIDGSLMTMYISHPTLTRDEWNLSLLWQIEF